MRLFPHFALLAACCLVCSIKLTNSADNQTEGIEKIEDGTPSSGNGSSVWSSKVVVIVIAFVGFLVIVLSSYFVTMAIRRRMEKTKAKKASKGEDVGVHAPESMELNSFNKTGYYKGLKKQKQETLLSDDTLRGIPSITNYEKVATPPASVVKD